MMTSLHDDDVVGPFADDTAREERGAAAGEGGEADEAGVGHHVLWPRQQRHQDLHSLHHS